MIVPVGAFVTFESEEGFQRCITLKRKESTVKILGERPKLKSASEPTDIIWENREITPLSRFLRLTFVTFIALILLALSFSVIIRLKQRAIAANQKYVKQECQEIEDIYGDSLIQDYAVDEWYQFYKPTNNFSKDKIQSVLDCFCQNQFADLAFGVREKFYADSTDSSKNAPVCREWLEDTFKIKGMVIAISIGINIVNFLLKTSLITLVGLIKQDTLSGQMNSIKIGVFLTQFFNTGILLILAGANLSETRIPILTEVFNGPYTDFNSAWFKEIAPIIVSTMLIGAFMPVIEFLIVWTLKWFLRGLDRAFSKDIFKSKKKSI